MPHLRARLNTTRTILEMRTDPRLLFHMFRNMFHARQTLPKATPTSTTVDSLSCQAPQPLQQRPAGIVERAGTFDRRRDACIQDFVAVPYKQFTPDNCVCIIHIYACAAAHGLVVRGCPVSFNCCHCCVHFRHLKNSVGTLFWNGLNRSTPASMPAL